jgi:hypothetical protein
MWEENEHRSWESEMDDELVDDNLIATEIEPGGRGGSEEYVGRMN